MPSHSVNDIIRILELEEKVTPGILCRSTLQRHMQARGHPFRTGHGMSGSKIRYFSLSVVLYAAFTDYTNVERRNKELDQKKIGSFSKCSAKKKGFTQEQLAEHFNVTGRTVSRWDTGSNNARFG